MDRRTGIAALTALLCVWSSPPAAAQMRERAEALAEAVREAQARNWDAAEAHARAAGTPAAAEVVVWMELREGVGGWEDYVAFLERSPGWPARTQIRRHAERAMPARLPAAETLAFFSAEPPGTGAGALRLAQALEAEGRPDEAEAAIARAWRTLSMSPAEAAAIRARYGPLVAGLDVERLDMLLWNGLTAEAAALVPHVPEDWQALAEARIAVRKDLDGSTARIAAVPAALRDDPGLAYERYLFRVKKGRWDEAEDWLLERSASAEALGRPEMWMERRANLARQALRRGDVERAYALAAQNFGGPDSGADYADAEWVAGFVALTRMDDPQRAIGHFERFAAAVRTPISRGRAGYWLGRAHAAAGDEAAAEAAYREAATYQTSFYGQLAAEAVGMAADRRLAGAGRTPDWRTQPFMGSTLVRAGYLLHRAGDETHALMFFRHAAEGLPLAQRAALAQMMQEIGRPHWAVRLAKDAAAAGVLLPGQAYPLPALARAELPVPTEFALAIARQESEFNPRAVSAAGARGLMQLMPATAEEVAGKLGLPFEVNRLTHDPAYNARLGSAYLARMLAAYDGSFVMAAAAYNAGPGRVRDWVAAFGDPRDPDLDAIVWIESIPFEETRNYVMRVLEGLHVYRARLAGATPPVRLASDIRRAG